MISIAIGDVAHGNSALIREDDYAVLVDAAPGGTPEDLVRAAGLSRIDEVIISHADSDHIGGLASLLLQFDVTRVWVNGDPARAGKSWDAVRAALSSVERRGRTVVRASVSAGTTLTSPGRRLVLRVLAPDGSDLLYGTGSSPPGEPTLTANSLSAVIGVFVDDRMEVLLPGDTGVNALDRMRQRGIDLRVPLLVFPHHGGRPGTADPVRFATALVDETEPEAVLFSVGRQRRGFPRPEIVDAVRRRRPDIHVACTQLGHACATDVPAGDAAHLHSLPAAGRSTHACCLGTLEITSSEVGTRFQAPDFAQHQRFVDSLPGEPLCVRQLLSAEAGEPNEEGSTT